jgi:hypothetical protein
MPVCFSFSTDVVQQVYLGQGFAEVFNYDDQHGFNNCWSKLQISKLKRRGMTIKQ